jgi:hypothetical protein
VRSSVLWILDPRRRLTKVSIPLLWLRFKLFKVCIHYRNFRSMLIVVLEVVDSPDGSVATSGSVAAGFMDSGVTLVVTGPCVVAGTSVERASAPS